MNKVFRWFQGRHTTFACAFFVSGTALHLIGKLDSTYIMFMSALMGFVVGHSIQENLTQKPAKDTSSEVEEKDVKP